MEIQTVKYTLEGEGLCAAAEAFSLEAFLELVKVPPAAPTAYVADLKGYRYLLKSGGDIIEDRGEKRAAIDLSRYLLGRKKIPAVFVSSERGGYTSVKRVLNGIQRFLARAGKDEDDGGNRIFLVGVSEYHFEELSKVDGMVYRKPSPFTEQRSVSVDVSCTDVSERLIDLLSSVNVPEALEKAYVGNAECIQLVRKLIIRVARSSEPVLILGDTGTGKEIVAEQINRYSNRPEEKFKRINCAAFPSHLFEAEIFGIEDKTATGVGRRVGLWEQASGGTLFLDEIADLPLDQQAKILRAIQQKKIRRVGGTKDIDVDTRIVAATNRNLFSLVQRKQFREDLYYRLRGLLIATPALREHPEDIPALAHHLWDRITGGRGQRLSREIIGELCRYTWPGNVRELYMVLSGLYSYFYDLPVIELKHLRGVFAHQRQVVGQDVLETDAVRFERERLESLKYLYRVYDIVKAAREKVQPVLKRDLGRNKASLLKIVTELQFNIDELDLLLQRESHLMPRPIYDSISKLQSTLLYFSRIRQKDPHLAVRDLRDNMPHDISAACAILEGEIARLKEDIGPVVS